MYSSLLPWRAIVVVKGLNCNNVTSYARPLLPSWEKASQQFLNRGVSHFFGKGPDCVADPFRDCVADPFRTVPRRCCFSYLLLTGRERGKGQIGKTPDNAHTNRENRGQKVPKGTKNAQTKEGQVQIGKPPLV